MNDYFILNNNTSSVRLFLKCKSCRGRGHVLNVWILLFPLSWFLSWFDRHNSEGFTREHCEQCEGLGWIDLINEFEEYQGDSNESD